MISPANKAFYSTDGQFSLKLNMGTTALLPDSGVADGVNYADA